MRTRRTAAASRSQGGEEEAEEEEEANEKAVEDEARGSGLLLTPRDLSTSLSDDSSDGSDDDSSPVASQSERAVGRLTDEAALELILDCNGVAAEQAEAVTALTIFQQHRYRRMSGLAPFSALRHLELIHQSNATHTQRADQQREAMAYSD